MIDFVTHLLEEVMHVYYGTDAVLRRKAQNCTEKDFVPPIFAFECMLRLHNLSDRCKKLSIKIKRFGLNKMLSKSFLSSGYVCFLSNRPKEVNALPT